MFADTEQDIMRFLASYTGSHTEETNKWKGFGCMYLNTETGERTFGVTNCSRTLKFNLLHKEKTRAIKYAFTNYAPKAALQKVIEEEKDLPDVAYVWPAFPCGTDCVVLQAAGVKKVYYPVADKLTEEIRKYWSNYDSTGGELKKRFEGMGMEFIAVNMDPVLIKES